MTDLFRTDPHNHHKLPPTGGFTRLKTRLQALRFKPMKTRVVLTAVALLAGTISFADAGGWRRGCGGFYGGPRVSVGVGVGFGGWGGGYCGPRWGWGPPVAVAVPVYRQVIVERPVRVVSGPAATLLRAQTQLARLGYYTGAIDGAFGPLTSRAIREYQADYGLRVTGRLDRATVESLGG